MGARRPAAFLCIIFFSIAFLPQGQGAEVCYNGSELADEKDMGKTFTGSVNCRDEESNIPTRNLTYRKGVLVQIYKYRGMQLESITEYYDSGKLKAEIPYSVEGIDGEKKEYYENGKLKEVIRFKKGELVDRKEYPQDKEGEKKGDKNMEKKIEKAAQDSGPTRVLYPNGKLKELSYYDGDSHVSSQIIYNVNGSIRTLKCGDNAKAEKEFKALCGFDGPKEVTLVGEDGKTREMPTYHLGKVISIKGFREGVLSYEVPADRPDGLLQGMRKSFYENGKLQSEVDYRNNERVYAKYYSKEGRPQSITLYDAKGSETSSMQFTGRGELSRLKCQPDSEKHPEFRKACGWEGERENFLHDDSGERNRSETFVKGALRLVRRFEQGKLAEETPLDGTREDRGGVTGVERRFYPNGKVRSETTYLKGSEHGLSKRYFESGKLEEVEYKEDQKTVAEISFTKDGKVSSIRCGKQPITKDFLKLCGYQGRSVVELYSGEPSTLSRKESYLEGKRMGLKVFNSKGVVEREETTAEGESKKLIEVVENYPSGAKKLEMKRDSDGERVGSAKEYFESGQLAKESIHEEGIIVSEKEYFMNGTLKKQLVREKGSKEGGKARLVRYTEFYDNGQKREVGSFFEGKRNVSSYSYFWSYGTQVPEGKRVRYADDGAVLSEEQYTDGKLEGLATYFPRTEATYRAEVVYKAGKRVSEKRFDASDRLLSSEEYYEDGSRKSK